MNLYNDNVKTYLVNTLDFELDFVLKCELERQINVDLHNNVSITLLENLINLTDNLEELIIDSCLITII